MGLKFLLCPCLLHGRYVRDPDPKLEDPRLAPLPVEVGSREMAGAMLEDAMRHAVLDPGDVRAIEKAIADSMMVVKDDWIEEALRQRIQLWNLAAATVNDPTAFGATDFSADLERGLVSMTDPTAFGATDVHAYHALVDGFGQDDPQPA